MTKFPCLSISVFISSFLLSNSKFKYPENEYSDDKQFRSKIARCEYSALRLGSEMADVFNAPVSDEDWNERVHQDYIVENLGFAPWIANGIYQSGGKTLTGLNAKEVHSKGGWTGKSVDDSPYAVLNHKWVYMFGDSTTRQVWASFAASFQGNNFERNAKEWTRHYCNGQTNRVRHVKGGHFDDEGWRGPCGVNEVTCHLSGFGDGGLLSFDWKHFPYEDYDDYLWGDRGPWIAGFPGEGNRRPDILTIQFGMHSCWHSNPNGLASKHLEEINQTMIEKHIEDIPKLMKAIRRAIDIGNEKNKNPTTVIILTSGSCGLNEGGSSIDECILRFNRIAADSAHAVGFSVLERGEIERRLLFKSFKAPKPLLIGDMHLPQPAQNVIATCLLHLMTCLNNTVGCHSDIPSVRPGHQSVQARPVHSPPG